MPEKKPFDELAFFADMKKRPGIYLGRPSLLSLRDQLFGMDYAFGFYEDQTPLRFFRAFVEWYHAMIPENKNGYACWWNHILYICGQNDEMAFHRFFELFERWLREARHISLPGAE